MPMTKLATWFRAAVPTPSVELDGLGMPLSRFSSAIRNTGIAFGWIDATQRSHDVARR